MRSCQVMFEGGQELADAMKRSSKATVRVLTDDAEISVGHLVFKNAAEIRVSTFTYNRHKRRMVCEVYSIRTNRVRECRTLN